MFAVRGDSPTSIRDLVGRLVAFGARGSGLVLLARYVLDGMIPLGFDVDGLDDAEAPRVAAIIGRQVEIRYGTQPIQVHRGVPANKEAPTDSRFGSLDDFVRFQRSAPEQTISAFQFQCCLIIQQTSAVGAMVQVCPPSGTVSI
jgi:hypothetical protein